METTKRCWRVLPQLGELVFSFFPFSSSSFLFFSLSPIVFLDELHPRPGSVPRLNKWWASSTVSSCAQLVVWWFLFFFPPFPFPFFFSFFFFFFFTTRQRNNGKRKRGRGEWRVEESIPRDLDTPWGPVPTLSTTPVRFHTPLDYIHRGRWMNIRLPRRRRYSRLRLFLYLFFLSFFLFF